MGKFKALPVIVMVLIMTFPGGGGHAQTVNPSAVRPTDAPHNTDPGVSCSVWYSSPTCDDPVSTTVVNVGEIDTNVAPSVIPGAFLRIELNRYNGISLFVDNRFISNIPAGASVDIPSVVTIPAGPFQWSPISGTQYLQIDVDPFDQIPESNKTNNTASRTLPDLEPVVSVAGTDWGEWLMGGPTPPSPAAGLPTRVMARSVNSGQMPPTYYLINWTDEFPTGTFATFTYTEPSSPAGGRTNKTGAIVLDPAYIFSGAGIHNVCVTLDADMPGFNGLVPESNETNNTRCQQVNVHQPLPDLTPMANWRNGQQKGDLRYPSGSEASCVVRGRPYPVSSTARNVGELATVNPVSVRLLDSAPASIALSSPASPTIAPGFSVGGQQAFSYTWTPTTTGAHNLTFDIDLPGGVETEYIELTNNAVIGLVDVKPDGADLEITYVAPLTCKNTGTGISPVVTVRNMYGDPVSARVEYYLTDETAA